MEFNPQKVLLNSLVIIQILGCCLLDLMQPNNEQWMFSVHQNEKYVHEFSSISVIT